MAPEHPEKGLEMLSTQPTTTNLLTPAQALAQALINRTWDVQICEGVCGLTDDKVVRFVQGHGIDIEYWKVPDPQNPTGSWQPWAQGCTCESNGVFLDGSHQSREFKLEYFPESQESSPKITCQFLPPSSVTFGFSRKKKPWDSVTDPSDATWTAVETQPGVRTPPPDPPNCRPGGPSWRWRSVTRV
jgi:hypothetical protein